MTDPTPTPRSPLRALGGVLLLALLIRLLHFLALLASAHPDLVEVYTSSDMWAFLRWAEEIRAGDLLGRDTFHPHFAWMDPIGTPDDWARWWGGAAVFHQAPLYPYLLAGCLALTGGSLAGVLLIQLLASVVQPLILFQIGRRLAGQRVGLIAAAISALYGPLIAVTGVLLRDWLPPILEPLVLLLVLEARARGGGRWWLGAGAAAGLAYLTKPSALPFAILTGGWVFLERGSATPLRDRLRRGGLLLAGFLLVLTPLLARNLAVGAPLLSVSTRAPEGIIEGNARGGQPVGTHPPSGMRELLEAGGGSSWAVLRATLATWDGDALGLVGHQVVKLRAVCDPLEVPSNVDDRYARELSPALAFSTVYGAVAAPGLLGFLLMLAGPHSRRRHAPALLFVGAAFAVLLIPNVVGRYRLVLASGLLLYTAVFAGWVRARLRAGERKAASGALLACAALLVGQHTLLALPGSRADPRIAAQRTEYAMSALLFVQRREWTRALAQVSRYRARADALPQAAADAVHREAAFMEADVRLSRAHDLIDRRQLAEARLDAERAESLLAPYPAAPDLPGFLIRLARCYGAVGAEEHTVRLLGLYLRIAPRGADAEWARTALARLGR